MICPMCLHIFRGNKFYRTGAKGVFRKCPSCEAEFKEPARPKKELKWASYEDWVNSASCEVLSYKEFCAKNSLYSAAFSAIWDAAREQE